MIDYLKQLEIELTAVGFTTEYNSEHFRLEFLSKKGKITVLFDEFKLLSVEDKKKVGAELNFLKRQAEDIWKLQKEKEESANTSLSSSSFDTTLPVYQLQPGSPHPLKTVENELVSIFSTLGFDLAEGSEIEDDYHNFGALNFAEDHPARDMQDTFFIGEHVLRTHTSSVQVREMEKGKLPLRLVMPGRVYRNEAVSSRSNCFFHQIEGLYIDKVLVLLI